MPNKYLINKKVDNKRLVIKKDTYNWIVLYGSAQMSMTNFEKTAEHWYYTSIESMFLTLHDRFYRLFLETLEMDNLLTAIGKSQSLIIEMAQAITEMGVENGWK